MSNSQFCLTRRFTARFLPGFHFGPQQYGSTRLYRTAKTWRPDSRPIPASFSRHDDAVTRHLQHLIIISTCNSFVCPALSFHNSSGAIGPMVSCRMHFTHQPSVIRASIISLAHTSHTDSSRIFANIPHAFSRLSSLRLVIFALLSCFIT